VRSLRWWHTNRVVVGAFGRAAPARLVAHAGAGASSLDERLGAMRHPRRLPKRSISDNKRAGDDIVKGAAAGMTERQRDADQGYEQRQTCRDEHPRDHRGLQ